MSTVLNVATFTALLKSLPVTVPPDRGQFYMLNGQLWAISTDNSVGPAPSAGVGIYGVSVFGDGSTYG